MRSFSKFIGRHLSFFLSVVIFTLLFDIIFFYLAFRIDVVKLNEQKPSKTLNRVTENLHYENRNYLLDERIKQDLLDSDIWIMILNSKGEVFWKFNLPEIIPMKYSIQDVANFSKGYIKDYPVFTQNIDKSLLVMGYPQNSYSKIISNYIPIEIIEKIPLIFLSMFVFDILILFMAYYLSKRSIIITLDPIMTSIEKLLNDEPVKLNLKGELKEVAETINETSRKLKKQNQQRANWISGVSHDIRTPLSIITGYAERIYVMENVNDDIRAQVNIIKIESERITRLISDLNLVSQLNYNIKPINKRPVYICKMIRSIVCEYLNSGFEKNYDFNLYFEPQTFRIQISLDERLITRAVQNIILNSITHNQKGCRIDIYLEKFEDKLRIIIEDNGVGVSKEKLTEIRNRPHYLKSTDDRLDLRHGLGLLLVEEIVTLHDGEMEIMSVLNEKFKTVITMPVDEKKK